MLKKLSVLSFVFFLCASVAYSQSANHDLVLINASTDTPREFTITAPGVYNIDESLGTAGSGNFTVKGGGATASDYILSGILVSTDGTVPGARGSFFRIANANTFFTLQDITVSSANITGSGSVLTLSNAASSALITNAIIENNSSSQNGGAIYVTAGGLSLDDVVMQNNTAGTNGGAVYNTGANGKIYVLGTVLFDNNVASVSGGAVYNNTSGVITSTEAGSFMSFSSNSAAGSGGAVYNVGTVNLGDSLFDSNAAANGGALYNTGAFNMSGNIVFQSNSANTNGGAVYNTGNFTVLPAGLALFHSNYALVGSGGALYNTGTVYLSSAEFVNNSADLNGGAVYNSGNLNFGDVIMDSNESSGGSGGAVYNFSLSTVSVAVINIYGNAEIKNNISDSGGAGIYNNKGQINVLSGGFLSFDSNKTLNGSGGALYNGGTAVLSSAAFTGNEALSGNGGAVHNAAGSRLELGYVIFDSNESTYGGAIYNISGSVISLPGSHVEFLSNTSAGNGGAIYTYGTTPPGFSSLPNHFVLLLGESVFRDNSAASGGAIYNDSSDKRSGVYIAGPSEFSGNSADVLGGAIYNQGIFYLDSSSGDIIFTANTAAGLPNDVYNDSTGALYINGNIIGNSVIFNGGIAGQTLASAKNDYGIFKTGFGTLWINGDSSQYIGDFFLSEGQVTVSSDFFTGYTEITGGVLDLVQGGNITSGTIRIYESGIMNIDTADDLVFTGQFLGDPDGYAGGTLTKTASSTGTLILDGAYLNKAIDVYGGTVEATGSTLFGLSGSIRLYNGRDFLITTPGNLYLYNSGLVGDAATYASKTSAGTLHIIGNNSTFQGTYEQFAGVTTVHSARGEYGSMFTGINNIYDSVLNVSQSFYTRNIVTDIGHNVNLFNNARQNFYNRTVAPTILNPSNVTFMGNNSVAYFGKAREEVRQAQYILNGKFNDYGSGNLIIFEDSIVTLAAADYTGLTYLFEDSVFDLTDGTAPSYAMFNGLSLAGANGIKVGIDFTGAYTAVADQLYTNSLSDKLYLFDVFLYSGADAPVTAGTYYAQVLNGGLTFDYPASKSFTAIKPFNTFDISIDPSRLTEIMIEVTAGLDRHSLYSRNAEYGARGFSIEAEMVYNIDMSLSDTEEGIFVVKGGDGLDRDPSKYVISGILMDNFGALIGGSGSFFNLVNVTDLELLDLTIRDASISSDGSVLRMTNANADAVFSNIILENNFSDNRGGAIYAAAGELYIDSVTALGNIGYLGGVLYASDDVKVKFDNATRFTGNSAFSGGVIYAENVTNSITLDNSNVLFDSNNAADFGGVIYSFNSPLSFVDSTIIFSNNTADYGGVIYADSSDIDFTGGNITFSDNISAYGGGAIYATGGESSLSFYETLTRFTDNISGNGGAIAVLGSTMSISVWASDVLFEGNSASKGADIYMENSALNIDIVECNPARVDSVTLKGGIYVETDQNTINKTGSGILTLMGDNYLQGAFNVSGGRFNVENAFYEHENGTFTLSASRGMYISGSTMSFSDTADVIITNNSYDEYASRFDGSYGGALTVSSGSSVTFEGNVDFINNLSYDYGGGAIYNDGSSVYFNSDKNINFSSNKTDPENDPGNYGGAVYNVNDALLSFSGAAAVSFDGNTALAGGAIANLGGSQVVFDGGSVVFARNEAEGFKYGDTPEYLLGGGAVYNDGGSSASFNDISADFSNNTAVSGGAIANNGASTLSFSASTVIFSSNSTNGYHYSDQSLYDWNGGAIHNVGGSAVNFDDTDAVFLVNSAYAGGAVYNDGASKITFTGGKTKFIENSVINESNVSGKQYSGGALYNAGASTAAFIGGDVTFSSNTGRALVNTGGSTAEFDNVNAVFSYNTSAFNGGAVLNEAASVLRLIGDIEFSNNRSSGSGGAIYNSATAYLTADNSDITFSGNRAASSGGAIYNASGAVLNLTTDNGDIVFTDNMIGTGTSRNDIYNIGRINIEGNSGSVIVNGGISGTSAGYIYKSGNNDFYINGNSSGYAGRFIQTGGNTIVTSNYFTGISSITAGVLELSTGTVLSGGTIGIYGAGDMEITTQGNLTFSGNVIGNGTINKPSAGMLTLTGNNSGFTGVYTQTAGTTTVNVTGSMFTGTNNIESSLLNVTHSGASMGYNVNLGNGGISRYYKADASVTALSAGNITFTGDNALAYFGGSSASMVSYLLNGAFANSGSGNEVVFDNAYVSFGSDNFTNDVLYSFNNSTVSISNALTGPGSTRTVTFDDISVSNSKLDFGVTFDAAVVGYDRLVTASSAGSFDLGRLIIKHDMDAGLNFDYRLNVLDGVEFNAGGVSDVATTVYEYEAKVADDDYHDVILKAVRFSDAYSLDRQNMKYNERAFLWSYAGAYHEGNSLHDMSSGTFYVGGYSQDASESLLSGLLYYSTNTATGRGSFFNIEGSTEVDFYLYDLTVSSAQANGDYASDSTIGRTDMDGSVIRVMSDFAVVNVSNVIFDDNEAFNNGGVIYSGAGIMNISSSAFINNKALGDGGALYVTNSTVNLNTDIGDILFAGNTANGADNDIYLGDYADLQITGSGNTIISGGILSDISSSGIEVRKSGSGTVYLGGVNKVYGNFNVDDGTLGFNDNVSYEGTSLSVAAGASLNMHNASADTADVETFNSSGNLTIDIFSAGTNDIINTSSADITGGSLAVMVGSGTYYNDRYYLITATDAVAGKFASSSLSEPLRYRLFYNTNNVWLDVNYFYISSFSALSPLTFNQKQTAKAIDRISHNASAEWGALIDHMMWDLDDNGQRYILAHLSGYFLANVVRNAAADIPSKQIYDKIKNHDEDNITSSGLWAQVRGGHEIWFGDENSLEDYKDSSLGAMVGFDRYLDGKNLMYGIYAGVSKDWIKQDKNEADGTRGSLGIYSGYIKEDWEVKGLLLGSMDTFDTKREVLGAYADGVIDALTISADLEGALKFELTERMLLRPFIGLEAANVNYKSFDEKGAGMYNLNVNGGNYFRSSARVGAGIEYVRHKWGAYASAEARYLITGYKPEVESVFVNTDIEFLSRGTTEGQIEGGINAGVEKKITNNFKVFANANLTAADRYGYIGGNVGLRYVFGRKNALLAKYLERAYQLANSADKDSGKVENFVTLGQYPKAKEYAVTGLNKVDETFGLFDLITSALDSDRNMKVSEKSTAEERLAHIDDIAERAKNRIMSSLYDIKELEEAKGYIDTAEKHLSAADEAKKLDMQDKVVSEGKLAVTAIDEALKKTGEAQEKVNTRAASQEQIVADAKIAIAEADKALQKAGEAQHRLASTAEALSKEDIEFIEKSIERTAEKARKLKNKAEQLIESEENVSKKANERRRNPGAIMIRLHVASFDIDEAVINSEDEKNIKEAADDINKIDFKKITVEGHTDNTGTHEHNVGLSQRRAAVVKDKLIEYGVPAGRISYVGFAETMPIQTNETKEGRAANRRTEIFIE